VAQDTVATGWDRGRHPRAGRRDRHPARRDHRRHRAHKRAVARCWGERRTAV